jgi:hypothetical protein
MLRGNGGHRLFFLDADYQHLYDLLGEGFEVSNGGTSIQS